ncbi:MAG TPA: thiolase family protein [Jatrophihabitans sp.]|nr:thiolase family protein [Jatrophihabitans sp.]
MNDDVVVLGYARTPFGRFGGSLRDWPVPRLAAVAITEAIRRAGLAPDDVDELVLGTNFPGSDRSIARQSALWSGIPDDRTSYTVDQACCSSLTALTLAGRSLRLGESQVAVGGGSDNLSLVPYFLHNARWGRRLGDITMIDQLVVSCPFTGVPRAVQAGEEAMEHGIGRQAQDEWALRSQQRFAAARDTGHLDAELVKVLPDAEHGWEGLLEDECPRPDTNLERLATLPTVYGSPTVTGGSAPNLSTGSTALVLSTAQTGSRRRLPFLARLSGWTLVSGAPARVASIPATAARQALAKTGLRLQDIDVIEINEAFAAVPLVTTLVLADGDPMRAEALRAKTNVNGGAIAVGHPTGATAGRLVMAAIGELRRRGGGRALVTLCGGIGEAAAVIVTV